MITINQILQVLTIALLVLMSAFFSASEASISAIPRTRLLKAKKEAEKKNRHMFRILSDRSPVITSILIGNNIVNILASSLATALAIHLLGPLGTLVSTVAMTVIILLFGEVTPKTITARSPEPFLRTNAWLICGLYRFLWVPSQAFTVITRSFLHLLEKLFPDNPHRLTEEELRGVMDMGKEEGVLEEPEHLLLGRAFSFNDRRVYEIMTPRTRIIAVSAEADMNEVRTVFRSHQYSRIPVYKNTIDSIIGVIHYKDVLFLPEKAAACKAKDITRPVLFVPETQTAARLLGEMHKNSRSMAIVLDERGNTTGIASLDDAVASVFGGISDEYDSTDRTGKGLIRFLAPGHITVPGTLKLEDLNPLLKTALDSDYYETIGGFLMEKAGVLPEKGSRLRYGNCIFTVEEVTGRRIQKIDILVLKEEMN